MKSFVYYPRTLVRQNSFCQYDGKSYFKYKHLGQGELGDAYLFKTDEKDEHTLVVKKALYNPVERYHGQFIKNTAKFASMIWGKTAITGPPYYVAMPYIRGVPLKSLVIESCSEALKIMLAVLEATKSLHDKNIVHGDLHSGNILIYKNEYNVWVATLIDFDFTREVGQTCAGFAGGPRAPECGNSAQLAETSQDIYSLGYTFRKLPIINEIGEDIISKMLSYYPQQRYSLSEVVSFFKLIDQVWDYFQLNNTFFKDPKFVLREDILKIIRDNYFVFYEINKLLKVSYQQYPVAMLEVSIQYWPSTLLEILYNYSSNRPFDSFVIMCTDANKLHRYCDMVVKNDFLFTSSLVFLLELERNATYKTILAAFKNSIHSFNDLAKFLGQPMLAADILNVLGAEFILSFLGVDKQYVLRLVLLTECFPKQLGGSLLIKLNLSAVDIKLFINDYLKRYADFSNALSSLLLLIDKYFIFDKGLHKLVLSGVNDIYREYLETKLTKSCFDGFNLFGRSYTAKLNEVSKLNLLINKPHDFKPQLDNNVVNIGKLGSIAQRVLSLR